MASVDAAAVPAQGVPDFDAVLREAVASGRYGVQASSVAVSVGDRTTQHQIGCAPGDYWEVASLSKSVGTAFAFEYFARHGIDMTTTPVNKLLAQLGAAFRVRPSDELLSNAAPASNGAAEAQRWCDEELTLEHLCCHAGLNMHYVKGVPLSREGGFVPIEAYLEGNDFNPVPCRLLFRPMSAFKYSGAGFIVLQYVIELHSGKPIAEVTRPFLDALGMPDFTFEVENVPGCSYVLGRKDDGTVVEGGRKMFPPFAAGGMSTMRAMQHFCVMLAQAYHDPTTSASAGRRNPISQATARRMLEPHNRDFAFMGCHIGVGIFVLLAADGNRFMLHQGANDGFRVLCFHCFDGADRGKGFSICSQGDEFAVLFNVHVARQIVTALGFRGVRHEAFGALPDLRTAGLKQEEIVNIGYRDNLLSAFRPDASSNPTDPPVR